MLGAPMEPAPNILILCTGNATRSVIAGAVLKSHLPHVEIATGGTMSIDGLPMSWRTKAGFEAVGVTPPSHRSHQVLPDDLDRATLIVGLAPEHVSWVRRTHPPAAPRTATLKRLVHDLAADDRPLAERVAELDLAAVDLQPWEEVVDPGGGEVEAFIACAEEVVPLVGDLAARLRLDRGRLALRGLEGRPGDALGGDGRRRRGPAGAGLRRAVRRRRACGPASGCSTSGAAPGRRRAGRPSSWRRAASSSAPTSRPR